jgi:hypothetical protein
MINHIRTLLLNMPPLPPVTPADSGEAMVDPGFGPVRMYGPIAELHRSLTVAGSTRDLANYRVNGLMALLHSPDFEPYLLRFDSRITYRISDFTYASEATPASGYPPFNLARLYTSFAASLSKTGYSLFDFPEYSADMGVFKDVWFGNLALKDRFIAGTLALAYSMERARRYGR